MNFTKRLLVLLLTISTPLLSQVSLFDDSCPNSQDSFCLLNNATLRSLKLYVGPEFYHVHRKREGGAKQDGLIYGIRAGYDRIKPSSLYLGFDVLYGKGTLDGHNAAGHCLKSKFSDISVEGRLGYTLTMKCRLQPSFSPYAGIGYFVEKNNFSKPRPTPIHFKNSYLYAAIGFLSQISITDRFDLGFNFKAKFPYEARCRVSNDPREDDSKQNIQEKFQYRAELPITYKFAECYDRFCLSVVPFYELRQYGHQPNYPCDFLETRLNIYGIQLKMMYCL